MKAKKSQRMGLGNLPRQRDLPALFGNPSQPGWSRNNIAYVAPPWRMFAGGLEVHAIQINKYIADDFKAILNEIWVAAGKSQEKIHEWGMDRFDGSFVVRSIRGRPGKWSNHAFAMACDFNAKCNPLGEPPGKKKGSFTGTSQVVKIFQKHGWRWGGTYKNRKDGMHFEAVSG